MSSIRTIFLHMKMDQDCSSVPNCDFEDRKEKEKPENLTLSKRARKRLQKREKWLQKRPEKRLKEKQKLKMRKQEAKQKNITLGPSRKALKQRRMSSSNCKIRVILDFSFDTLMTEKDLHKCVNQMSRCYSENRRCENPLQMYVTNFNGLSKEIIKKHTGYVHWDVNFCTENYLEIFKLEELIYLTSESDSVIEQLEEDKVYIIGAFVDHNAHKGLCLKIAKEQGIRHGRLPINQYVEMKTRQVLSIDQVFAIISRVASCHLSWKEAFMKVLPQRKGAIPKLRSVPEDEGENVEMLGELHEKNISDAG